MITTKDGVFRLDTENTTYIFRTMPTGHLQHVYYGARLGQTESLDFATEKQGNGQGTSIAIGEKENTFFPDNTCFECSSVGRGDYRESLVVIADQQENTVNEFLFESSSFVEDFVIPNLPNSHGKQQTLAVNMLDAAKKVRLTLYYSTFEDCDVIAKSVAVTNLGEDEVRLLRVMSSQLDLPTDNFVLDTLDGAWGRERYINSEKLRCGITKTDSKRGVSSNTHNPYVVLREEGTNSFFGNAYGFNLVYSGNHEEIFDKTPLGKVRALNGINEAGFCWHLAAGETFHSPEATLCFADKGTNQLSQRYHKFVNNHIVPKQWARERPVLVNNWEATYFDFTEKKLIEIAKKAKNLGIELFVLDDGWFGNRTNDTRGLGDWTENKKRLPQGLKGLAEKINNIGLKFGIWVEPEMINPDSDLYRAHPDWAVAHPAYTPLLCRNQQLLDLANPDVCQYVIDAMSKVFASANIAYVKWDFNRPLTDFYSPTCGNHQGEFLHRFIMGYYKIVSTLTAKFPEILFESCASGGNRVDLGVLCYMPQFWCSDNTDSFDRTKIHEGTLYGYPQSCIGSHVSAAPNHQTLRQSTIDNRFNTACIGAFGYELDLSELNKTDTESVKNQLVWYKQHRKTLQFGTYHRLKSVFEDGKSWWAIVAEDGSQAVVNVSNGVAQTIPPQELLRVPGLLPQQSYTFQTRQQLFGLKTFGGLVNHFAPVHLKAEGKLMELISNNFPMKTEVQSYTLTGEMLEKCGVMLNQQWSSCGYDGNSRVMLDFGSRLYSINKADTTPTK